MLETLEAPVTALEELSEDIMDATDSEEELVVAVVVTSVEVVVVALDTLAALRKLKLLEVDVFTVPPPNMEADDPKLNVGADAVVVDATDLLSDGKGILVAAEEVLIGASFLLPTGEELASSELMEISEGAALRGCSLEEISSSFLSVDFSRSDVFFSDVVFVVVDVVIPNSNLGVED